MSAIAGLRGTGDWGTDERPKNFRELILRRNPNGMTPLFALTAKAGKETTDDPEFAWWDESSDIVRLQVSGAHAAGDTTIVVDSSDPSASNPGIVYGAANHLVPGDVLLVEKSTEPAAYSASNFEHILVTAVISATQFTVQRGYAGTTAATIADDSFLLKIGSSYAEGTPEPDVASRNPVKYYNYTQIFKTAYELTGTAMETKARTGDPLKNDKRRKMFDHSRDLEMAMMFGIRSETTGSNGKPLRTTAGLRAQIPSDTTTIFGAAVTTTSFLDAVYKVFDWDTPAGDQRIGLVGNLALNELNKVVQSDSNSQIQFGPVIKQYGMALREWILPQGSIFLRTHPLMNRNSLYSKSMFIVDASSLIWRPMKGRDTRFKDNVQGNGEDTRKGMWMTEGGLEVRWGGLTNGYLGNISAT